jgi:hypothetical protein
MSPVETRIHGVTTGRSVGCRLTYSAKQNGPRQVRQHLCVEGLTPEVDSEASMPSLTRPPTRRHQARQ